MTKKDLRNQMLAKRNALPAHRKSIAKQTAFDKLSKMLVVKDLVLSFASFGSEIDLSIFNEYLAKQGRLLLPKMEGDELIIYAVQDVKEDLIPCRIGFLEPNPQSCKQVSFDQISLILTPGLAFDTKKHRLGYGKGYYDRLLQKTPGAFTIGSARSSYRRA